MQINLRTLLLGCTLCLCTSGTPLATGQDIDSHLAGGEFSLAAQNVQHLPVIDRDSVLAQIATAQGSSGEVTAAGNTIDSIQDSTYRGGAIDDVGGNGGGSFADFQSLMDLIQTTVVPDTWEALGGPSTMAPYPQGVYVDATGTVRECETIASSDAVADLKSLLRKEIAAEPTAAAWRDPSTMRCISLKRLMNEWTRCRVQGVPLSEAMTHLGGLSRVQYIFREGNDIILAGPVGGIESRDGWFRDRESGLNPLRLDFFVTTLAAAMQRQPFGCTIDPTTEGLQRAAKVAQGVQSDQIPIGKAADRLIEGLGMQRVEVFGTAGDTAIGYLMVEADRHMKQLALGIEPMPRGAKSYMDVIDDTIEMGPPSELLLRLWFTSAPRAVRADQERSVIELAGQPIRLSGQNERALASGQRGNVTRDPRSETFVANFNENWHAIRTKYPIYASLESVYRAASVSQLLHRFADDEEQRALLQSLAASPTQSSYIMPTPRQVMSIAKLHTVRHQRKIYNVLMASGGVAVDPAQTLVRVNDYPTLSSLTKPSARQPVLRQRWWWNVQK
ncbi:MAG: DUF1598 domain-containing protein [Planctomycetota bacterium]|nr:DUF1598 domain-containing protein [Planctomycetota bacterium]